MATRLETRVKKAKHIKTFTTVQKYQNGKPRVILVPGSEAKRYQVIVRRLDAKTISTECRCETGVGHVSCPGNSNGYVCYHSIAAVIRSADGYKVSFCSNREDAQRLQHLAKGTIGNLVSHQGNGRLHFVVYAKATGVKDTSTAIPVDYTRGRAKLFKS